MRAALCCFAAIALCGHGAAAVELGAPGDLLSIEVHGFASQGWLLTTNNNYLAVSTDYGSFEFTEVGLNFNKSLTDKLRAGFQLFARRLGPTGNFDVKFDWFFLDYRAKDWFGIRVGRVKLPFGLYNDIADIDAARVPILLPQSIYPTQNRDFLLAQTGAEIYGRIDLKAGGAFDYRIYGGTILVDLVPTPGTVQIESLTTRYIAGGRLVWETPVDGMRFAGSGQVLEIDSRLFSPPKTTFSADIKPAILAVGSFEYSAHNLLLAAEYSRWYVTLQSTEPKLVPNVPQTTSERAYVMAAYRVNHWFEPGLYYSVLYPDVTKRSGSENMEHDVAATLRFDFNDYWLLKLEGHYLHGTAALNSALNDNQPLSALVEDFGLFLVKTTLYF